MSVLILKNMSAEGPGTIESFLRREAIHYRIVDLSAGEPVPDLADIDTLVLLGGPMSVNDGISYITGEERLVLECMDSGKRILGICLGAQIMAKALGAKVYKSPEPEVGWHDITLCDAGMSDPAMQSFVRGGSSGGFRAFQWHGETFDIPASGCRLASSAVCPNQAFRYGDNAYAFQFHPEVNERMIYDWMSGEKIDIEKLKSETRRYYDDYIKLAFIFYGQFLGGRKSYTGGEK
jgi:GMP synthase (glutamine-hydrolysing)